MYLVSFSLFFFFAPPPPVGGGGVGAGFKVIIVQENDLTDGDNSFKDK